LREPLQLAHAVIGLSAMLILESELPALGLDILDQQRYSPHNLLVAVSSAVTRAVHDATRGESYVNDPRSGKTRAGSE
jgi:hypothetical protein